MSDDGSVAHPSPDWKVIIEALNLWGQWSAAAYQWCVSWHRNGLGSILAGQVPEKSERRRLIEGEGLNSYCVNLGHTAVIDKYCITSCRSLDRRPPLTGENSCMWGGQCWPPWSYFSRSLDVVLFLKASCLIQIKHILSHLHPASFGEYLFVKQTQLDFQTYITCLWSNFYTINNNEVTFATRVHNALVKSIIANCWPPNYVTIFDLRWCIVTYWRLQELAGFHCSHYVMLKEMCMKENWKNYIIYMKGEMKQLLSASVQPKSESEMGELQTGPWEILPGCRQNPVTSRLWRLHECLNNIITLDHNWIFLWSSKWA